MEEIIKTLWQGSEGESLKQKEIQQKTWPIILFALISETQDESKEKLELPNVIICRRYYEDEQNDMGALKNQLPEILGNVTYLSDPSKVVEHLMSDRKNIVFVWQYFNYNMTGTQVASVVKEKWLDSEVALITSIDVPCSQRSDCDYFYQINSKTNQSDGANIIVHHLKNRIKVSVKETKEVSAKDL